MTSKMIPENVRKRFMVTDENTRARKINVTRINELEIECCIVQDKTEECSLNQKLHH